MIKRTHENGTDNLRAQLDETKQLIGALSLMVAAAIDAKQSNHHTMRVVEFTKYLIEAVNKKVEGSLADVSFSEKKKEELRLAACFHDIGMILIPFWLMEKSTRLTSVCDRIEMIRLRFALFRATLKTEALEKKNKIFFDGRSEEDLLDVDRELDEQLRILEKDMEFITECNSGGKPLATIELKSLKKIAEKKFTCDGRGYPAGLKGEELSLQSRILAVADFYEVLSKKYRSHVTPTPFEVIVSVLERAAESGAFDSDIIDLLLRDKVHEKFEKAYEDLVRTSDDG